MCAKDALRAIQALMNGKEWSPDTLNAIAEILDNAGYPVADSGTAGLDD